MSHDIHYNGVIVPYAGLDSTTGFQGVAFLILPNEHFL